LSLVWTTIILLILLLPGFLFFVGLYSKERMSRDVAPSGALGQLSGVVLFAFLTHGILYLSITPACHSFESLPCVSVVQLAQVLQLTELKNDALVQLDTMFGQFRHWIFAYVLSTSGFGYFAGARIGKRIVNGGIRILTRHAWIYDLLKRDTTSGPLLAFVLTNVREGNRFLMYRGFLRDFYFAPDGRIAYLVLKDCRRYYLVLDTDSPKTSDPATWKTIGETNLFDMKKTDRQWSYLMIEGEDIANVVFDAYRDISYSDEGVDQLKSALADIQERVARFAENIQLSPEKNDGS
jgi:hypothetical protein